METSKRDHVGDKKDAAKKGLIQEPKIQTAEGWKRSVKHQKPHNIDGDVKS